MKYDLTPEISCANERVSQLREALPSIMKPSPWWRRGFSMADRLMFIEAFADARASLFRVVNQKYPELKGRALSIGSLYIETDEEPPSPLEPAETTAVDSSTDDVRVGQR